mmetsp:Transcript_28118/g.36843  ORF Transcript_28118/g.36843 Transcript_28118/m.36843 type:complete len:380 (+) Transcript_28118:138-1277(+)
MRFRPFLFCNLIAWIKNFGQVFAASKSLSQWPKLRLPLKKTIDTSKQNFNCFHNSVTAVLNYCASDVTFIKTVRDLSGTDGLLEGAKWEYVEIPIANGREEGERVTLDRNGFELISPHNISELGLNFLDSKVVVDNYYTICEKLLKEVTGAKIVKAFDHNVRSAQRPGEQLINGGNTVIQQPAGIVHNDFTCISAARRLQQLAMPPKANDVLRLLEPILQQQDVDQALQGKRRYAFINVWRNIRQEPVEITPLACCDAQSNCLDDLITFQIVYSDRIGENFFVKHSSKHQWKYFPHMLMDEALLIKQWDSAGGIGRGNHKDFDPTTTMKDQNKHGKDKTMSTFAIHSAFLDQNSPKDAPPRESIEVRCVLMWDEEDDNA